MTGRRMRWPRPLRALRRDRRGLALIEFAMILPILLILYLGSVQSTALFTSTYRREHGRKAGSDAQPA